MPLHLSPQGQLDPAVWARLLPAARPLRVRRGQVLLRAGEVCQHLYFVQHGALRMYYVDRAGHEHTRYFSLEGYLGTGFASFILQEPSVEFVESLEAGELFSLSRAAFYELVDRDAVVAAAYREILEHSYAYSVKRIGSFMALTAREQFEWLLAYQPHLLQRFAARLVASYLDITPETLSRLKKEVWQPVPPAPAADTA